MSRALLFVSRAWTQLASSLVLIAAARLLGQTDIGIFALASVLTLVLTQWVGVGSYEYLIRDRSSRDATSTAFWLNLAVAAMLGLAGAALALPSASWFDAPQLSAVVLWLAPLTLPSAFRVTAEALLLRDGHITALATHTLLSETLGLAAGVIALYCDAGLWSLVIHKWTQTSTCALLLSLSARLNPRWRFDRALAVEIYRFGGGILANRIIGFFQIYGVDLVIGAMLSPAAVAVFRLGSRLVSALTSMVSEPVRQLSWKEMSEAQQHDRGVAAVSQSFVVGLTAIHAGPMIGIAATSDLIVRVVLGEQWREAAPVISYLALSALATVPNQLFEASLGVAGHTRWLAPVRLLGVVFNFSALLLLVHRGPTGVALSQLLGGLAIVAVSVALEYRLVGTDPRRYFGRWAYCLAAGGLMAALVVPVKQYGNAAGWPPIATLAACIALGGAVYAAAMAWLFREPLAEVRARLAMRRAGTPGGALAAGDADA
jgi:O-antigen/teichoic acid export membrane protein